MTQELYGKLPDPSHWGSENHIYLEVPMPRRLSQSSSAGPYSAAMAIRRMGTPARMGSGRSIYLIQTVRKSS
jgi:hypothetical protein